tara:strand:- start:2272 stop:2502 length:231 start_codon:yes stop_codon:yes gene_type:complete
MATNNPANDRYNPPGNMVPDFEEIWFSDLEVNELFWQTNQPNENNPWRKQSDNSALNLKTQTVHNFNPRTKLYQKI